MTPVEKAKELLGDQWLEALEAHLKTGYVISSPDAFLMGRPCLHGATIVSPWQSWPIEIADAWFIWAGVGSVARLFSMMPVRLPWIGFMRQKRGWADTHWLSASRFESALAKLPKMR